ncbi:hypothetical protein F9B74_07165 [Pelistega sp. NLN82]|uniref:Uncharacterized protein n=1 Tax=Pelistega ratti TaxID=2652177 RepID=A0A6L9Y6K9_9BURK|nr:hypothetical protein [Pelistega ratti]NEN76100.1 hypothetical protein [Pelistega ratti]
MFGSSKKQVLFNPSNYHSRRSRRMPRWLMTFLAGIIIGSGGFWFLQTNYVPQRISIEESNRLQHSISELEQEKNTLQRQLVETQSALTESRNKIQQLQATASSRPVPTVVEITPIQNTQDNTPLDLSKLTINVQSANFTGSRGKLNYDLTLNKSMLQAPDVSVQIAITTTGQYINKNKGFEQFPAISAVIGESSRLQGSFTFDKKPTLTPQAVDIRIIDAKTRKVLATQSFSVAPVEVETVTQTTGN